MFFRWEGVFFLARRVGIIGSIGLLGREKWEWKLRRLGVVSVIKEQIGKGMNV